MKGRVGVGYRLFNESFTGLALSPGDVINDYALLVGKVSEFAYDPIIEHVEGLALRRVNFNELLEASYWKRLRDQWKQAYKRKIQAPLHEHREETVERFHNRLDQVDVRAFGVGVHDDSDENANVKAKAEDFEQNLIIQQCHGPGKLASRLQQLERRMRDIQYQLAVFAMRYDDRLRRCLGQLEEEEKWPTKCDSFIL